MPPTNKPSSASGLGALVPDLLQPVRRLAGRIQTAMRPVTLAMEPVTRVVRSLLACVSSLGWAVAVLGVGFWVAGAILGWLELGVAAVVLLLILAISALFAIGRAKLAVTLEADPQRVVVGQSAMASLDVTNIAKAPLLPLGIELPVGERVANFLTPLLSAGDTHSEIIGIPTSERCVIGIGPLRTQRGDPFGLIRREVIWTDRIELFVHPSTVPLAGLGAGLLRDLEGQTSNEVSMSDLAFHALREYVPGDDMRYVHWRSSARRSTTSGQNQFLVRQFLDTRRSHVVVATDVTESSYAGAEEFETAISCGASIAVRAIQDEMDLTVVCGHHAATRPVPYQALDTFSRAAWSDRALSDVIQHLPTLAPDMSVVVMVTGSAAPLIDLLRCRSYLPVEVRMLAIQVRHGAKVSLNEAPGVTVLTVGSLSQLPPAIAGGIMQ